jgi:hypothetical protein
MPDDIRKKRDGKERIEHPSGTQSSWGELSFAQQREILYPTEGKKSDRSKDTWVMRRHFYQSNITMSLEI